MGTLDGRHGEGERSDDTIFILQMSEFYTDRDIRETAGAIWKVANHYYSQGNDA